MDLHKLSYFEVKVRNFKCFDEEEQGFEGIKPINIIIGRNNSGKSSLLDLIQYVIEGRYDVPKPLWRNNSRPQFIGKSPLTEPEIKKVFAEGTRGGGIPTQNHWMFGQQFIGVTLERQIDAQQNQKFIDIEPCSDGTKPLDDIIKGGIHYLQRMADAVDDPFQGAAFKRIFAERNIVPETDSSRNLAVFGDGKGVTNIIQNFINKAELDSRLVEETLLNELNIIFRSDANFIDIVCQHLRSNEWEIYLEEKSKGRIPLSQSGSGLKTIILVLVYIHLVPAAENRTLGDYVFGFEELENNLHPALQRRLLTYLHNCAKTSGCIFFLTTHSNVEIDFFSKSQDAQITHVTHDGEKARSRTVRTYIENRGVLDDLDVRASDLLQSNGIIWVEGPSDRIYVNRWIELWSNGKLSEGNHYQCVFYGGRLLSHLSSEEPDLVEDGISILNVNKNSIILIDSDKRNQQGRLNDTKRRIIDEVEKNEGIAWVTRGKEIENYIPSRAIKDWLGNENTGEVGQYEDFFDFLNGIEEGLGKRYSSKKSMLAEKLSPYLTKEDLEGILDLNDQLVQVCSRITEWNNQ